MVEVGDKVTLNDVWAKAYPGSHIVKVIVPGKDSPTKDRASERLEGDETAIWVEGIEGGFEHCFVEEC